MLDDRSKESDDPHKVYQIISFECNYENQHTEKTPGAPDYPLIENMYNTEQPIQFIPEDMQQQDLLNHMVNNLTLNNQQQEGYMWEDPTAYNISTAQNIYPTQPLPVDPQLMTQNHMPVPVPPHYLNQGAALNQLTLPTIYDLEITVHYRSKEMLTMMVQSQRVQLHYLCEDPMLEAHPICLPSTEPLVDQKQIKYTQEILKSIQRGLLLEVRHTGIYSIRQGKCHVFASDTDGTQARQPHPNKLPQNQEVLLLSFEKFRRDVCEFQEQRRGSPDYTIYLCFGEKFPDGRPREKKLITVKVVPIVCRYFHEKAQMEGASSLQSDNISLQISHNSLYDLIHSTFDPPTAFH
ncbi:hypothetical protein MATL_G00099890 [Megalops atlanticus]|uniref:Interferon regulatory factor-3 domain-containing protein n=1 Tax=Megalops atlanticus TaxID=7932 RepID=A0A9D3Q3G7_MEGAT|nr:hypothetical protein MATL_G00099890 [Megalops atlanticus]